MFPRQHLWSTLVIRLAPALLGAGLLPAAVEGQGVPYPAMPVPAPVPASGLPSIPSQPAGSARTVQSPTQVPGQQNPTPQTPTTAPTPSGTPSPLDTPLPTSAPANTAPAYGNPLEAPIAVPSGQPGVSQPALPAPAAFPATQPSTASPTSPLAPATPVPGNPLEQPITVQPAQPPTAQPVEIAPPAAVASLPSFPTDYPAVQEAHRDYLGSAYIPDDSWVYPEALRLYSMGYLDSAFISMRPWTRRSLLHMLEKSADAIVGSDNEQAQEIYTKLTSYLSDEVPGQANSQSWAMNRGAVYGAHTVYTRLMGVSGTTLRDSYHLGQTLVNDYGRPYQAGFNNITGFSSLNEWNRFSLYVRGEYQHSPSAAGYSQPLADYLSSVDEMGPDVPPDYPQITIPLGPIGAANPFRLQEASLSFHFLGHEISGGKSDAWLGPAQGGAMAWSNNAENIYSFRIDRIEPMHIPLFSRVFGPLRYDFFVGSLKGHTFPRDPWVHAEAFSLRPTNNFEFSFERTVVWGGHCSYCYIDNQGDTIDQPITFRSFFRSFFSLQDTESDPASKGSSRDPGARYSDFSFSWRLPFLSHYVTLYTDSIAHDDVTPISAPRRAAYRPGIYISQLPGLRRMDFRVEASSTDTSTLRSLNGTFNYFEGIQRQAYTNQGFIMGDWVGREAKAGNAWLTYHLSGNEWAQLSYLYKKTPKDFIAQGTTQNQFKLEVVKRLRPDVELDAWYQYEHWIAPVYLTGHQNDNIFAFQFTFYPKLKHAGEHLNGK